MAPIQLTAVIKPKPGKAERFLQLFDDCVQYVKANEPGIHRYELHKGIKEQNGGQEHFIALEGYDNKDVLDSHMKTPPVLALLAAIEKEGLTETEVIMTTQGPSISAKL